MFELTWIINEWRRNKREKLFNPSRPGLRLRKTSRQTIAGVFCLCVLFLSSCFYLLPVYSRHLLRCLPPSLPPSTGWAGVHMIKPASQVITWRCQIKRPLIQMRSEISKSVIASAATAHPHAGDAEEIWELGGAAGRQRQHSAFHSYINITNVGNRAEHVRVHPSVFICITQPACPLLAAGILDGGCSATSTREAPLYCQTWLMRFLLRVSPKVRGWKCMNPNVLWSCHECSGHPVLPCFPFIWISCFCTKKKKKIKRKIKVSVSNLDLNKPSTLINSDRNHCA